MQTSVPAVPAQPDLQAYGTDALALFKRYNRASAPDAPPFNAAKPAKDWYDSSVDLSDLGNVTLYKVVGKNGKGEPILRQSVMVSAEAAVLNLPDEGGKAYPHYVIAPTVATRTGPLELTPQPVNPAYLSTAMDAEKISAEVGGTAVHQEQSMGGGFAISYGTEARRLWEVVFNGRSTNVGLLLANKNSHGVGAPGKWDLSKEEPVWVPDQVVVVDASAPHSWVPIPVRDLLPNEVLRATPMGVQVIRTDKEEAVEQAAGGSFTASDRATLKAIAVKVGVPGKG